MKHSQLWSPHLYYSVWYTLIGASLIIAANIWFWERFVGGFKVWIASLIKWLAFAFFIYNGALITLEYFGLIYGFWLWVNRAVSVALTPLSLAAVMSVINYRSYTADPTGKSNITNGFRLIEQEIAMTRRERARGNLINKEFEEKVHGLNQ